MGVKGIVIAEECHDVSILPPIDLNGSAKNSDVFSMAKHGHASILIQSGVSAGAVATVTVEACDDFVPSTTAAIAFNVYKEETADGDTLGARTAVTAAGFAMSTNNNIFYRIEIDAAELPAGKPCLRVAFTDPGASQIAAASVQLSDARYGSEQSATVIA